MGDRLRITSRVNPRLVELTSALEIQIDELKIMRDRVDWRFRRNEARLFKTEGRSGGQPWPALSPRYARWKRKKKPGRKIMVFERDLRDSLVFRRHPGHVRKAFILRKRGIVEVGTTDPKAGWHGPLDNNPLRYGRNRLPVRDTLAHTPRQESELIGILRDYFVEDKLPRVFRALQAAAQARAGGGMTAKVVGGVVVKVPFSRAG